MKRYEIHPLHTFIHYAIIHRYKKNVNKIYKNFFLVSKNYW